MPLSTDDAAELVLLKEDLALVRVAIRAILGGAQSYSLDTSQTRQSVTKADLSSLRLMRDQLRSEVMALESQRDGGGTFVGRPGW